VGNGFIKDGVGALVLKGANTYPGGTTVANGALIVNNTSGSGTGPGAVTVNSTGMLMGNGTVAGAVSVSGGAIAAGASVGKLTLQNGLDMSSGGTNAWELGSLKDNGTGTAGTDFDQIAITSGSLNLAGSSVLTLNFLGATAPNAANAFWQAPHVWTIVKLSGGATNSGGTAFTIPNPTNSAGTFSNSVVADGIVLIFTPSSVPRPMIQNISGNTTSATISWNANSGVNYQVQYNTNLSTTNWLVLSNVSGASGPVSIADNHGVEPQRFYRLVITP
jgi:fibronectin-binding autotransporter adhesin